MLPSVSMTNETGFPLSFIFLAKLFNTSETVDPESHSARTRWLFEGDIILIGIICSRLFSDDDERPHFAEKLAFWQPLA